MTEIQKGYLQDGLRMAAAVLEREDEMGLANAVRDASKELNRLSEALEAVRRQMPAMSLCASKAISEMAEVWHTLGSLMEEEIKHD